MSTQMLEIEISGRPRYFPDLREAWWHRRLALVLAQRNIKVRYMQTVVGSAWIALQPLLVTGVLAVVFGAFLSVPTDGISYPFFIFSGTVIWSTFQRTLNDVGVSLANSSGIVLKVYFPRILIPISAAVTSLTDIIPAYVLLLAAIIVSGHFPGPIILASPLVLLMGSAMALALGLWVTMLDAVFRDIRLVIPSILQLVFYATPIVYSETAVPEHWRPLYHLNPFIGLVEGFRYVLIAQALPPNATDLVWSCTFLGITLLGGLVLLARLETFSLDQI